MNKFLSGAAILAGAGIICRLLGVVIRIPLTNIVGNFGMGLYQMVFPLYALLLVISSAGVPVAISKMVAREKVNGDIKQCKRILLNALVLLGAVGLIVSALFMIFAHQIAKLQGNADVGIIYLAIAPSVFIVCLISAYRGYFQGFQNMIPTATSQIIEQIFKVGVALTLALILIKQSVVWAVFGAILAVTVSETIALLFLFLTYFFTRKKLKKNSPSLEGVDARKGRREPTSADGVVAKGLSWPLMWQIIKQSAPITLMASVFPLLLVFDSMIVINILRAAGETHQSATQLCGISSGAVHTLINLPAVLGIALATVVVPAVSSLIKQNKTDELRAKCALAIKIIFVLSLFFAVFYLAFAEKIIDLLYHGAFLKHPEQLKTAASLMRIESVLILLMGLGAVFTAMMQGADKAHIPLIAIAIGGTVKIIFELIFLKTGLGIYAVSIGNVICFLIATVLNTVFAFKYIKIKKGFLDVLKKTVVLAAVLLLAVSALVRFMPANRWWVLADGAITALVYVGLVFFLKFFDKSEWKVFNK